MIECEVASRAHRIAEGGSMRPWWHSISSSSLMTLVIKVRLRSVVVCRGSTCAVGYSVRTIPVQVSLAFTIPCGVSSMHSAQLCSYEPLPDMENSVPSPLVSHILTRPHQYCCHS